MIKLSLISSVILLTACTTPQQPTASGVVCILAACQVNITSDRIGETQGVALSQTSPGGGGVPCGGCWNDGGGREGPGGVGSGGDLNLRGGAGIPFNRRNQDSGFNGESGVYKGVTFYAAGGGGAGKDGQGWISGGHGGSVSVGGTTFTAGTGGSGKSDETGSAGGNYGAGAGAWLLYYTSPKQRLSGGTVTNSGGVWAHVITSGTTLTVLT